MRYSSAHNWARYFEKHENVIIDCRTIENRLKRLGKIGITGRSKIGTLLKDKLYAEDDVREACADFLTDLPQADENGFFEKDGVRYGMVWSWIDVIKVSQKAIERRLAKYKKPCIKGKTKQGKIYDFYSETDVRDACGDRIENIPQADKDGFFIQNGEKYGTAGAWERVLGIRYGTILKRLRKAKKQKIKGKLIGGNFQDFYSETDVRDVCSELLKELPQADRDGFFVQNGIKYGSITAWSKVLNISDTTIKERIKTFNKHGIQAKTIMGNICIFYPEPDVLSACADLLSARKNKSKGGEKRNNS